MLKIVSNYFVRISIFHIGLALFKFFTNTNFLKIYEIIALHSMRNRKIPRCVTGFLLNSSWTISITKQEYPLVMKTKNSHALSDEVHLSSLDKVSTEVWINIIPWGVRQTHNTRTRRDLTLLLLNCTELAESFIWVAYLHLECGCSNAHLNTVTNIRSPLTAHICSNSPK